MAEIRSASNGSTIGLAACAIGVCVVDTKGAVEGDEVITTEEAQRRLVDPAATH